MDDTPECYTRLPNSVLEWLYGPEHDLTMRQVRVLMVVFRYTYGFSRRSAALSSRFIADATGIDQSDCVKLLRGIVEQGLLDVSYDRKIGFYTLCSRRYKNKRKQAHSYADEGIVPSRGYSTLDNEGVLPSKIIKKQRGIPITHSPADCPGHSEESPSKGYGMKTDLGGCFFEPNVSGECLGTSEASGNDWEAIRELAEANPDSLLGELLADGPPLAHPSRQIGADDNDSQEDPLKGLY